MNFKDLLTKICFLEKWDFFLTHCQTDSIFRSYWSGSCLGIRNAESQTGSYFDWL